MDWNTILHFIAEGATALVPVAGLIISLLVGAVFYQLTGFLPGFVRAYIERAYRENEAEMRQSIERALLNGLNAALTRGRRGNDALSDAIAHAMRTNPEGVDHFMQTSGMTVDTLKTQAAGLAHDKGIEIR